jgi:hypothetical protein
MSKKTPRNKGNDSEILTGRSSTVVNMVAQSKDLGMHSIVCADSGIAQVVD